MIFYILLSILCLQNLACIFTPTALKFQVLIRLIVSILDSEGEMIKDLEIKDLNQDKLFNRIDEWMRDEG